MTGGNVREISQAIRDGDRRTISKTITLLESSRSDHAELGQSVLEELFPDTGQAYRIGITGPPGVGKSTFIEALGLHLIEAGHRPAVLAVDPTSPISGGSILGDKTRMQRLASHVKAYIRPSPTKGSLGGVGHRTREALLVCEAAGFDVVIVETVGVGQSEINVRSMVDYFAVLLQPGAGDELQGIKRGVLELADALIVNKADGDQMAMAERARIDHERALHILQRPGKLWQAEVMKVSAMQGIGMAEVWDSVRRQRQVLSESGELEVRRRIQDRDWLWRLVEQGLVEVFRNNSKVSSLLPILERAMESQEKTAAAAARELLRTFRGEGDE